MRWRFSADYKSTEFNDTAISQSITIQNKWVVLNSFQNLNEKIVFPWDFPRSSQTLSKMIIQYSVGNDNDKYNARESSKSSPFFWPCYGDSQILKNPSLFLNWLWHHDLVNKFGNNAKSRVCLLGVVSFWFHLNQRYLSGDILSCNNVSCIVGESNQIKSAFDTMVLFQGTHRCGYNLPSKIYTALKDTSEKAIENKLKYVLFPEVASIVTSIYVSILMLKRQTNRIKQN